MKKAKEQKRLAQPHMLVLVLACVLLGTLISACSQDLSKDSFIGTWDLVSGNSSDENNDLSEESVNTFHALGLDAYLNLDESGSLTLVNFDQAQLGTWKPTSNTSGQAVIDGQNALIELDGSMLRLIQNETELVFEKGEPKIEEGDSPNDKEQQTSTDVSDISDARLSDSIMRGALLDEAVLIVDSELCNIEVNGIGVDKIGDPGYNLNLTNNSSDTLDFWIAKDFTVNGKQVSAYLYESIPAGESTTAFLQFNASELTSSSPALLKKVEGTILVDKSTENKTVASYNFTMD